MATMQCIMTRPYVDWSQFSLEKVKTVEPEIYLSKEQEEVSFEIFRRLSHKVAGCRYDIPWGHEVIVAYNKTPNSSDHPQAVGIITFSFADEKLKEPTEIENFMEDYFHKISFIFVDQSFQRKGIGRQLLTEAMTRIKNSGIKRSVRLEGAKSAVKFFKKMGFTSYGRAGTFTRGSLLFRKCFYMQCKFPSSCLN